MVGIGNHAAGVVRTGATDAGDNHVEERVALDRVAQLKFLIGACVLILKVNRVVALAALVLNGFLVSLDSCFG